MVTAAASISLAEFLQLPEEKPSLEFLDGGHNRKSVTKSEAQPAADKTHRDACGCCQRNRRLR